MEKGDEEKISSKENENSTAKAQDSSGPPAAKSEGSSPDREKSGGSNPGLADNSAPQYIYDFELFFKWQIDKLFFQKSKLKINYFWSLACGHKSLICSQYFNENQQNIRIKQGSCSGSEKLSLQNSKRACVNLY